MKPFRSISIARRRGYHLVVFFFSLSKWDKCCEKFQLELLIIALKVTQKNFLNSHHLSFQAKNEKLIESFCLQEWYTIKIRNSLRSPCTFESPFRNFLTILRFWVKNVKIALGDFFVFYSKLLDWYMLFILRITY